MLTMEEDFDFLGDNDRRKEARRKVKDRREMVRYEVDKDDRRVCEERRRVMAATKETQVEDIDAEDIDDEEKETKLDSVIGKIGNIFGR